MTSTLIIQEPQTTVIEIEGDTDTVLVVEQVIQTVEIAAPAIGGARSVADITDFAEGVDDRVSNLLVAGSNITLTYDDTAGSLTIASTGGGGGGAVTSVAGRDGDVTLTASDVAETTTRKWLTDAERTKLTGVASGATANSSDATLLNRANHTGTQAAGTITGLATVATSGAYGDLSGRPTLGTAAAQNTTAFAAASHTHVATDITDSTSSGRTLLTAANAGAQRTALGLVIGTDVQAQNARLQDVATNLSATSGTVEKTGANTFGTYTVTAAAKTLLDDATVGDIRTTLGLATVAATGAYSDLSGLPTLGTAAAQNTSAFAAASHAHAASDIVSGVIATARLASTGTASSSTFLRGDQTWATIPSGVTNDQSIINALIFG